MFPRYPVWATVETFLDRATVETFPSPAPDLPTVGTENVSTSGRLPRYTFGTTVDTFQNVSTVDLTEITVATFLSRKVTVETGLRDACDVQAPLPSDVLFFFLFLAILTEV